MAVTHHEPKGLGRGLWGAPRHEQEGAACLPSAPDAQHEASGTRGGSGTAHSPRPSPLWPRGERRSHSGAEWGSWRVGIAAWGAPALFSRELELPAPMPTSSSPPSPGGPAPMPPPPRPHRAPGTEHPRLRVQAPLSSPAQGPASRGGGTTDPNHSASEGKMRKKMRVLGTRGWGSPAHTSNVHIPGPKPALFPRGKRSGAPGCSARSSTAPAPGSWREIQPKTSSRRRSCCCWGAGGSPGPAPPAFAPRAKEIDPK